MRVLHDRAAGEWRLASSRRDEDYTQLASVSLEASACLPRRSAKPGTTTARRRQHAHTCVHTQPYTCRRLDGRHTRDAENRRCCCPWRRRVGAHVDASRLPPPWSVRRALEPSPPLLEEVDWRGTEPTSSLAPDCPSFHSEDSRFRRRPDDEDHAVPAAALARLHPQIVTAAERQRIHDVRLRNKRRRAMKKVRGAEPGNRCSRQARRSKGAAHPSQGEVQDAPHMLLVVGHRRLAQLRAVSTCPSGLGVRSLHPDHGRRRRTRGCRLVI